MKTSNSQCYSVHGNKTRPKESTRRSGQFLRGKVFEICHDLQASSSSCFLLPLVPRFCGPPCKQSPIICQVKLQSFQ